MWRYRPRHSQCHPPRHWKWVYFLFYFFASSPLSSLSSLLVLCRQAGLLLLLQRGAAWRHRRRLEQLLAGWSGGGKKWGREDCLGEWDARFFHGFFSPPFPRRRCVSSDHIGVALCALFFFSFNDAQLQSCAAHSRSVGITRDGGESVPLRCVSIKNGEKKTPT